MSILYRASKRMIERGQIDEMAEKLDLFYLTNKLSEEEYKELSSMLVAKETEEEI